MNSVQEEQTLAYLADTQFNNSYYEVFVAAYTFSEGREPIGTDLQGIDDDLHHYLHGGDLPVYAKHYLRQRGAFLLPA